jgi:hypothetical protein
VRVRVQVQVQVQVPGWARDRCQVLSVARVVDRCRWLCHCRLAPAPVLAQAQVKAQVQVPDSALA